MRNINKRSTGYKTRAELKKERKELKRKSKMKTRILIGIYDSYLKKDSQMREILDAIGSTLIGSFSTHPDYTMYERDGICVVKEGGNTSIRVEVWEVTAATLDKIEKSYSYYSEFENEAQEYVKEEITTPFGDVFMYFTEDLYEGDKIIVDGDWVEYLNYKKVVGNTLTV